MMEEIGTTIPKLVPAVVSFNLFLLCSYVAVMLPSCLLLIMYAQILQAKAR